MIHLRAENWSSLGDDTFWCWAEREFPGAMPADLRPVAPEDHVLHYGLLGAPEQDHERTVALLWEQHPEMARALPEMRFHSQIERLHAAASSCARRTVATPLLVEDYRRHGSVDVLPIGVDTHLWKPLSNDERLEFRERHGIPRDVTLGFWGGHGHPMKGWDQLLRYAATEPDYWWVVAFKFERSRLMHGLKGVTVAQVSQPELAGQMGMCDFALFTSRLRPFSMLEWEAMACNLPVVNVGHPEREFCPSKEPRRDVFDLGWDRASARRTWLEYLGVVA